MNATMKKVPVEKRLERLEYLVEMLLRERDEREMEMLDAVDVTAPPGTVRRPN